MRHTAGYFSTMEEGWGEGSIPKPVLESIFSFTEYLNEHKLPLLGIIKIPKRIKNCDFISVCGVYQIPAVSHMRCFTVSRKGSESEK